VSNDKKIYTIIVKNARIEVSEEVYKAYYQEREHEKYMDKVSREKNISLDELMEIGFSIESNCSTISKESAEDEAIKNILIEQIKEKLKLLEPEELFLIKEIFEKGISERELARKTGIQVQTLNDRKKAILNKLYWLMKK